MLKKTIKLFHDSLFEFRNTKSITTMAMLMALTIVLGYFTIQIGDFLKIGFTAIPHEIVSMLFGPTAGAIFGGLADILKYMIKPTGAFFPGFTISGIIGGVIYGILLYKKPLKWSNLIAANVIVTVFVNMILNTYWLTLLYGTGFLTIFPARALKEVVMCIINVFLMYVLNHALHYAFKSNKQSL